MQSQQGISTSNSEFDRIDFEGARDRYFVEPISSSGNIVVAENFSSE
jgi:hypothetical protein